MILTCDTCGYCSNEVRSGAGVSEKGSWIALHFTDPSDVSRDILKVRNQGGGEDPYILGCRDEVASYLRPQ